MIDILLLILMAGAGLHLIYLYLVRPVFIRRIKYRVYALRDNLRLAAIRKEIPENEPGYRLLEQHLNALARNVGHVDLSGLVLPRDKEGLLKARSDIEIMKSSDAVVRNVFSDCRTPTVAAFILNSPLLVVAFSVLVVFALFTQTATALSEKLFAKAWHVSGSRATPSRNACAA